MPALIFDCDGVLADTERDGHRVAFNQTFRDLGLPIEWSEEEYGRKLQIAGGKERMASELTPEFAHANGLPTDPEGTAATLADCIGGRRRSTPRWWLRAGSRPGRASGASSPGRRTRAG